MILWTNRLKAVHHIRKVFQEMMESVRPLPVTPKAKEKSSGRKRVSESADSTTVAGKLIKTDDCQQPSRDVSSTENQKGSQ